MPEANSNTKENYGEWTYSSITYSWVYESKSVASPPCLGDKDLETTYTQILIAHEERLKNFRGTVSAQVLMNHKSALNSFLTFCGKTLENRVGREFMADFVSKARSYVELAHAANRKTAADKLSILRNLKKTVDVVTRKAMLHPVAGPSIFHKELRLAVASSGLSIAEISRATGAAHETLSGWLEGLTPTYGGLPTLRRLESFLGLDRGYLESKIATPKRERNPLAKKPVKDKYGERVRQNLKDSYYVSTSQFSQELTAEWFSFLKYKTVEHPLGLKRGIRAKWRVLPLEKCGRYVLKSHFCQPSAEEGCASAYRTLLTVQAYMGFLTKAPEGNAATAGLGLPLDQVQTLAIFAIPEFVNAYFEFVKARSGGLVHNGQANVAGAIIAMTREDEGYLWQQPEFFEKISRFADGRTWHEMCAETKAVCQSWHRASVGKKSRDPKAPLNELLKLKDPLAPLKNAIQQLDAAAAACPPGASYQAAYKRDALLLAIMIANPLRLRTLSITKYASPETDACEVSNLYRTEDGDWHLRFYAGDFKNDGSKSEDYDAPLPRALADRIERYVDTYLPILIRNKPESPWLFPTIHGDQLGDLGEVVSRIARSFIPEVIRLRPHAIRHIVATDFLRRNPGQYKFVADLLHDKLETVLRNYAHGQTESAFRAHEKHLSDFFDGI